MLAGVFELIIVRTYSLDVCKRPVGVWKATPVNLTLPNITN